MATSSEPWDVARALHTYNIARWGNGYFGVNDAGNMTVRPGPGPGPRARSHGGGRGGARPRPDLPAAAPLPGSAAPPRAGAQRGIPRRHRRGRLPGRPTAASSRSRSTSCARWWRKSWTRARPTSSASRSAASRSSSPRWPSIAIPNASSSATATRTRSTSRWRCSGRKLGKTIIMVVEKVEELQRDHRGLAAARRAAARRRAHPAAGEKLRQVGAPPAARTPSSASPPAR